MLPTVGRIIHVHDPKTDEPCRAALVTGVEYGAGRMTEIYLSVWTKRGDQSRAVLTDQSHWHWPLKCERNFLEKNI